MSLELKQSVGDLAKARSLVRCGKYESALLFFDGFLAQLSKYMYGIRDSEEKELWKSVKSGLKEEYNLISKLHTELLDLRRRPKAPSESEMPDVPDFDKQEDRFPDSQQKKVSRTPQSAVRAGVPPSNNRRGLAPQRLQQAGRQPQSQPRRVSYNQVAKSEQRTPGKPASNPARNQRTAETPDPTADNRVAPTANQYEGIAPEHAQLILECMVTNSSITYDQISGLADAKRLLQEAVVLPLLMPQFFTGVRSPWRGVLLHGPPGTGKSLLARATAAQAGTTFFSASASTIESRYRGDAEKMVRALYTVARAHAPSCIFIDEIDALVGSRSSGDDNECSRRIKAEFLTQIQGVTTTGSEGDGGVAKIVMTLAATNLPWDLDEALRRRLEKRIYIPLPDLEGRRHMLQTALKEVPLCDDVNVELLAERLDGYSGADISIIVRESSMNPLRRAIAGRTREEIMVLNDDPAFKASLVVTMSDFDAAMRSTRPSVSKEDIKRHTLWSKEFGSV